MAKKAKRVQVDPVSSPIHDAVVAELDAGGQRPRGFAWATIVPLVLTVATSALQKCLNKDDAVEIQTEVQGMNATDPAATHTKALLTCRHALRKARRKEARVRGVGFNNPALRAEFALTEDELNRFASALVSNACSCEEEGFCASWDAAEKDLQFFTAEELQDLGA